MIEHEREHTGEKPYQCDECEIVLVIKADTLEEASSTEVNSKNKVSVEYGVVATNQGSLISDVKQEYNTWVLTTEAESEPPPTQQKDSKVLEHFLEHDIPYFTSNQDNRQHKVSLTPFNEHVSWSDENKITTRQGCICPYCGKIIYNKKHLGDHIATIHSGSGQDSFTKQEKSEEIQMKDSKRS